MIKAVIVEHLVMGPEVLITLKMYITLKYTIVIYLIL